MSPKSVAQHELWHRLELSQWELFDALGLVLLPLDETLDVEATISDEFAEHLNVGKGGDIYSYWFFIPVMRAFMTW